MKKKERKEYVRFCPQCLSTKVKMPPTGLDIRMTIRDVCESCGFRGNFPLIEKKQLKLLKKK